MANILQKTIVAMDLADDTLYLDWLKRLQGRVAGIKLGMQIYTRYGPRLIEEARAHGLKVFLDLKYHDIPNTVHHAVSSAASLGVWLLTVHSDGGEEMLKAAAEAAAKHTGKEKPKIMAVTVLTSQETTAETVIERAKLARSCGCDGVIASAKEITAIRKATSDDFLIVTPGIRPPSASVDDQKRVATPEKAIETGANYLVMGRPILQAKDPEAVLKELQG